MDENMLSGESVPIPKSLEQKSTWNKLIKAEFNFRRRGLEENRSASDN